MENGFFITSKVIVKKLGFVVVAKQKKKPKLMLPLLEKRRLMST